MFLAQSSLALAGSPLCVSDIRLGLLSSSGAKQWMIVFLTELCRIDSFKNSKHQNKGGSAFKEPRAQGTASRTLLARKHKRFKEQMEELQKTRPLKRCPRGPERAITIGR